MNNFAAIFKKQLKDALKNKEVLIQFVMFPVLTVVMTLGVKLDGMPENFFISLFATMYICMAPLSSAAALIAEEKEKGTLRVLLMSGVKPQEFLTGIGGFIWAACMIGSAVICALGRYDVRSAVIFMAIMAVGILISLVIGGAIGLLSPSQTAAHSVSIPLMLVLSLLPMLSAFNNTIAKAAKMLFLEQIRQCFSHGREVGVSTEAITISAVNLIIAITVFVLAYRKNRQEI